MCLFHDYFFPVVGKSYFQISDNFNVCDIGQEKGPRVAFENWPENGVLHKNMKIDFCV